MFFLLLSLWMSPYVRIMDENLVHHSGVVIKTEPDIYVLTCSHMMFLKNSKKLNVHFFNNDNYIGLPADIVKRDDDADLMLLKVSNLPKIKIDPVLVSDKILNSKCSIISWNNKIEVTYKPLMTSYKDIELFNFVGKGVSGMSGSAIISDGKIIAIQSLSNKEENGSIIGASVNEIRKFLK